MEAERLEKIREAVRRLTIDNTVMPTQISGGEIKKHLEADKVLYTLANDVLEGRIGEMATEEEIEKFVKQELLNRCVAMEGLKGTEAIYVNEKVCENIAKALVGHIPARKEDNVMAKFNPQSMEAERIEKLRDCSNCKYMFVDELPEMCCDHKDKEGKFQVCEKGYEYWEERKW